MSATTVFIVLALVVGGVFIYMKYFRRADEPDEPFPQPPDADAAAAHRRQTLDNISTAPFYEPVPNASQKAEAAAAKAEEAATQVTQVSPIAITTQTEPTAMVDAASQVGDAVQVHADSGRKSRQSQAPSALTFTPAAPVTTLHPRRGEIVSTPLRAAGAVPPQEWYDFEF